MECRLRILRKNIQLPNKDHPGSNSVMIGTSLEDRPIITANLLEGATRVLTSTVSTTLATKKLLLVGAGGIGCELLKNLCLLPLHHITVLDMDTIELSNLNRQFLFTKADIGSFKAEVAVKAIKRLYPEVVVDLRAQVGNVKEMTVKDFLQFDLVLSALDNLEARRHVNLMAVMAGIPVVESGTAGYQGQVGVWVPGMECFDCRHHSPPTTFPVCTIRATPTLMIHCIVWAKEYLIDRLFGDSTGNDGRLDEIEDEGIKEALLMQERAFEELRSIDDDHEFALGLIQKLYIDDIEDTLANVEMWKGKEKLPQVLGNIDFATPSTDSMQEWSPSQWLQSLHDSCIALRHRPQPVLFDKDDDLVMSFVAAAANLRAFCYQCQPPSVSLFKAKEMAGNIIPAVATTNSIAAALAASLAVNVLAGDDEGNLANVYISHGSTSRVLTRERLVPGDPECVVCSASTRIHLQCDLAITLTDLMTILNVHNQEVMILHNGRLLFDSVDMDTIVANRTLFSFGIQYGHLITVQSDDGNMVVAVLPGEQKLTVLHRAVKPAELVGSKREHETDSESDYTGEGPLKAIRLDQDTDLVVL